MRELDKGHSSGYVAKRTGFLGLVYHHANHTLFATVVFPKVIVHVSRREGLQRVGCPEMGPAIARRSLASMSEETARGMADGL